MSTERRSQQQRRQLVVRRAVIVLLALFGMLVLTAYLRESQGGPLHEVQTDAGALVSPVKGAAARAAEPVGDAWSWTTGLVSARQDAKRLSKENALLRQQVIESRAVAEDLQEQVLIESALDGVPTGYQALTSRVTGRSVSNLYSRATVNVGPDDGVVVQSPVIAPAADGSGALVGHVIAASGDRASVVTFITDPRTQIGARILGAGRAVGMLSATTSGALLLSNVPRDFEVKEGDVVVTAGFRGRLPSVYPPDIPIGTVVDVGGPEGDTYPPIQVDPYVDPRVLGRMIVLGPDSDEARRRAAG
jgi:rod shape-determining protein MreC